MRNTIINMKPTISPIGLFKRDIMENGSLIYKKKRTRKGTLAP